MPLAGTDALQDHLGHLMVAVETLLREHPAGLSELSLIRSLQNRPWELLGDIDFSDPARLYPAHFLVFHCLYRLRDELAPEGESVAISPLLIRLYREETVAGDGLPDRHDDLRAFYLDLSGYELPESTVQRMLDDFWSGQSARSMDTAELQEAAGTLGLYELPSDFAGVKRAFRRRAMQSHPDRGGSSEAIQAINEAFTRLRHYYRASS
ncbi:DnaJ-like protein [Tamilnaduibacter salinus]|nr:DNA-J related domain-containing protein [Tamilnaduibacter salinus]PVY75378.1 DnaJ-like protein [Tamilnaduibacter salinus]